MSPTRALPLADLPLGEPPMVDREASWIAFDARVLEEAKDPRNPLLERVRFLSIFHTNLDEFFMIRVSGVHQQVEAGVDVRSHQGQTPRQRLDMITDLVRAALADAAATEKSLVADLDAAGITLVRHRDLSAAERRTWNERFVERVLPTLTPLAISSAFPFPFISNLSLNLAVMVTAPDGERRLARIKVPDHLPPLVGLDETGDGPQRFLRIEDLISANLHHLFPGMETGRAWAFRVTRDADVEIREDEADDLLKHIEGELRKRRFGEAVRLEVAWDAPRDIVASLQEGLDLLPEDVHRVRGVLAPARLARLCDLERPELKFPSYAPRTPRDLVGESLFDRIARGDILLHHPFDAFTPVAELVRQAARDPAVLAIKQTLYRTSGNSPVIGALLEAVERGKQVAAVVELKARFDEENNIGWARALEQAGVHVIYGVPGLKTHAKLCLIVRREEHGLRRYAHIGTGNYNPVTARIYTDLGLFTCDPEITADVADLFNRITGFALPPGYRRLQVAPRFMKRGLIDAIRLEAGIARAGGDAHVILKTNAVTEPDIIEALYDASRAGVRIDLLVRGICSVVPGRPGLSETITVRSVVGRFLEHTRVFWFSHAGDPVVWIGSADLMGRNLNRRVEVLVPILDPGHRAWLRDTYLQRYLDDTERSRVMQPDTSWTRRRETFDGPDSARSDVHQAFLRDA